MQDEACQATTPEALSESSRRWWESVKADPAKFNDWLADQYHGEATAAGRIVQFAETYGEGRDRQVRILKVIAGQEEQHAAWIAELLEARGLKPQLLEKTERYWDETLPGIDSFETGAAVGAHAEEMRLARIRVICADAEAPADVREVFARILKEEEFHARAFAEMAGADAYEKTAGNHEAGLKALGLTI